VVTLEVDPWCSCIQDSIVPKIRRDSPASEELDVIDADVFLISSTHKNTGVTASACGIAYHNWFDFIVM